MTTWLTRRTSWRFYKGSKGSLLKNASGSRAFLQAASSSSSTWDQTFWNSQYTSSFDDWWIFSDLGQVSVAWWKTSSQPTVGVNKTPTNTALTDLHNVITFHHANTRGSRAAKRKSTSWCPWNNCHLRVTSRPFATYTDHKHKFSLTHFIHFSYLSDGLTFAYKHCDTRPI